MGFFDSILNMSDPVGGSILSDALGLSPKKKRRNAGKKAQRKIDLYNQFIRGGLDLQEELQPRMLALERAKAQDSADSLVDIYSKTLGPASREMAAKAATAQREADLGDYARLGPEYTRARLASENADPREVQRNAYEDDLLKQTMAQFGMGADMDPIELRKVQQLSRMGRSGLGFGQGSENDLFQEALMLATHGEGLRQSRTSSALAVLGGTADAPQDSLMATLGRPATSLPFAQGAFSQSASRLTPYNAIEPTYGSDLLNAHYADLFSKRNKAAADKQAEYSLYAAGIGAVGSAAGGAGGLLAMCWVAREIFGVGDGQWLLFRGWVIVLAPAWFRNAYVRFGPAIARWLHLHPSAKPPIRRWMESKIAQYLEYKQEHRYAV